MRPELISEAADKLEASVWLLLLMQKEEKMAAGIFLKTVEEWIWAWCRRMGDESRKAWRRRNSSYKYGLWRDKSRIRFGADQSGGRERVHSGDCIRRCGDRGAFSKEARQTAAQTQHWRHHCSTIRNWRSGRSKNIWEIRGFPSD